MKNAGKQFEEDFMNSFPNDIFTYRLRDSAGAWGGADNSNKVRFTVTNMCDFLVCHTKTIFLELKSTNQKSMPFANLKKHQVAEMYNASRYDYIVSYFIFNFRSTDETFAIKAEDVHDFYHNGNRKSFSLDWCRDNGILIPQQIKRTRYRYEIQELLGKEDN